MLKKFIVATILSLGLISCNQVENTGADGYKFGQPQYEKEQVLINLVTYDTRAQFLAEAKSRGLKSETLVAFSVLKAPFDTCTIHIIKPSTRYEPEFLGHEFAHCMYGQWHTNNEFRG